MDVIRVPTSIDGLPHRSVIMDGKGRTALRSAAIFPRRRRLGQRKRLF
jgi:hypothetical protein